MDTAAVLTLDVLDAQKKVIRSYSSKEDADFVSFPGGPSPDDVLPKKAGLNRFVWDMRAETLPGVPKVFIEGSYEGRKMAPGSYVARFTFGKEKREVSFQILSDPRIDASPEAYQEQQLTLTEVENKVKEIHESILNMRKVKRQIDELTALVKDKAELKPVVEMGKSLSGKIKTWEEKLVQNKSEANDDVINFQNRLSADYIFVRGELDTNTPGVTNGQKERIAELNKEWSVLQTEMKTLLSQDVTTFNALCKEKKIEKITLP
ncbi:hypothetical protein [Arundinibacter roseus]|uniref:hypothetical protein n=1 Tax=Arundinibacter roseus TaxID=2070510 RepID=UPI001E5CEB5D|nr:hypothetical protein [Arundinibacter roseus]